MSTKDKKIMTRPRQFAVMPTEWALRDLPARVVVFLRAAGGHGPIRAALATAGYSEREHAEGFRLVLAACPFRDDGLDPRNDEAARRAARELDDWARVHFGRLRAALVRLHPDRVELVPRWSHSNDAVLIVSAFLKGLEKARRRRDPKSADALKTLAQRGFTRQEEERLGELVRTAKRAEDPGGASKTKDTNGPNGGLESSPNGRGPDPELLALYHWFHDWATTARALIDRRDWLIRLGLAERPRLRRG